MHKVPTEITWPQIARAIHEVKGEVTAGDLAIFGYVIENKMAPEEDVDWVQKVYSMLSSPETRPDIPEIH